MLYFASVLIGFLCGGFVVWKMNKPLKEENDKINKEVKLHTTRVAIFKYSFHSKEVSDKIIEKLWLDKDIANLMKYETSLTIEDIIYRIPRHHPGFVRAVENTMREFNKYPHRDSWEIQLVTGETYIIEKDQNDAWEYLRDEAWLKDKLCNVNDGLPKYIKSVGMTIVT